MENSVGMIDYYARRACEYEGVYAKPERQPDLHRIAELLAGAFSGLDVLEVACGTGYWTQFIAKSARSIIGIDINADMLELARQKDYGACQASFFAANAYSLPALPSAVNAGFHGFWWSHIPVQRIGDFLLAFHRAVPRGSPIVMIDNIYVEGSSTPIARRDDNGNTYQTRRLKDGSNYEIQKNFPSTPDLRERLEIHATDLRVTELTYYWIAEYR